MKSTATASEKQINPVVAITYTPIKALEIIGHDSLAVLAQLQGAKVTNLKTLDSASELLHDGETALERIVETREQFASRVKEAFEPFRSLPLFQGASINITLTIPLRQKMEEAVRQLKGNRAQYLAAEEDKQRRIQQERDAAQEKINRENAAKAAAAAKKAGASKETVATIKADVLATPAALVESKALDKAKEAGASVRYDYYAAITNYQAFFQYAVTNPVIIQMLADQKIIEATEKAFRPMARAQKDKFSLPGMTFRKVPVDVNRGGF